MAGQIRHTRLSVFIHFPISYKFRVFCRPLYIRKHFFTFTALIMWNLYNFDLKIAVFFSDVVKTNKQISKFLFYHPVYPFQNSLCSKRDSNAILYLPLISTPWCPLRMLKPQWKPCWSYIGFGLGFSDAVCFSSFTCCLILLGLVHRARSAP